jgi:hypothetical protein
MCYSPWSSLMLFGLSLIRLSPIRPGLNRLISVRSAFAMSEKFEFHQTHDGNTPPVVDPMKTHRSCSGSGTFLIHSLPFPISEWL